MENLPASSEKEPIHFTKHTLLWLFVGFLAVIALIFRIWIIQPSSTSQESSSLSSTPTPIVSGDITVNTPGADTHVSQDFIVTGKAKSDIVGIRLLDKYSGHTITEGRATTTAIQPGQYGQFRAELQITDESVRSEAPLLLEIFIPSGGQELNKLTLPLTFTPVDQ